MAGSEEVLCEFAVAWRKPLSVVQETTGVQDPQEAVRAYVDYMRRAGAYNCVPPSDQLRFHTRIVHARQDDRAFEELVRDGQRYTER